MPKRYIRQDNGQDLLSIQYKPIGMHLLPIRELDDLCLLQPAIINY